ncbi:MAG: hypothetical protein E2O50_04515 [Gammaproteobacteria bacterium]|nr:MAG: hypothetical protein E2O50_04515 [Gammaproteobacteria bacterium]
MTTPTYGEQQGKAWPLLLIALAISGVLIYGLLPQSQEPAITSDPESLRAIGWGDDQRNLKEIYTGRGTTIAALGYRSLGDITGCAGSDAQAVQRRSIVFSAANTGIEGCTVSSQGLIAAQNQQDGACLNAIENAVSNWQKNWSDAAAGPYEFLDVGSDAHGQMDGIVDIRDKVLTIERLAGWPIGDPVPGFESSPTVWSGDDSGWRPADNVASCPVEWLQCFDEKEALYAGIPGLETLGGAEGQCIVELSPDRKNNLALYGVFDVMREIAPDAKFVIAAFRVNREDSMSRAADWLIANQKRFNIVAARTSNIMFLETRLLNAGIQNLCGGETWCDAAGHVPYTEPCVGDPYAGRAGLRTSIHRNTPRHLYSHRSAIRTDA